VNAYWDHDNDEDEEDDWDEGDPDDADDSGNEPTVDCPYCNEEMLEDSPYCPHCERYISEEDHAGQKKPLWVILTALVCLGIAIWWVLAAFL